MPSFRDAIARRVRQLVASPQGDPPPTEDPPGDAGLFGPESMAWRVHGDFTSMMVGGIAALLLQMLHPAALAGVWDHSDFRNDRQGRLRRTAQFIARTTYGDTPRAEAALAHVRAIHARVSGTLPDGRPYAADDPQLLNWVHACEAWSFLAAYRRYRDADCPLAEQDRYLAETARLARMLGARDVPENRAELDAYFRKVRPELRYDARTREVASLLLQPLPAAAGFDALFFEAGKDLLPDWAQALHGFHVPLARRPTVRLGVASLGGLIRWSLPNSAEARARRRAAAHLARGLI